MTRRQKAIAFFVALCVLLVAAAISLNIGWIVITAESARLRVVVFGIITFGLHSTWLVNSATHLWGSRRFKTRDDSTNNWWVALITFGEGWHNNHHAHPVSARHGLAWYELDLNWIGISTLRRLGLAWDVKVAKIAHVVTTEDLVMPPEAVEEAVA